MPEEIRPQKRIEILEKNVLLRRLSLKVFLSPKKSEIFPIR
jgi:hypothetical protein